MVQRPIASISGIRGVVGESLSVESVLLFAQSFGQWLGPGPVILGRDGRVTGEMLACAAKAGLLATGREVLDIGIAPTPTAGLMVRELRAAGAIVITASHNPIQWNAMKFYGPGGTFLNAKEFESFYELAQSNTHQTLTWDKTGMVGEPPDALEMHIEKVLSQVDVDRIHTRKFKVALDGCRGAGSVIGPRFLERLGCDVVSHDCTADGRFTRVPEPSPASLQPLASVVRDSKADIGFALDPDADRLVIVAENGEVLSEELTLAVAVDHVLSKKPGPVAINLATTMLIEEIAAGYGVEVYRTKIGEINVTSKMLELDSPIGGEGNGGVIYPAVQPGRDALTGIGLILEALAEKEQSIGQWVSRYPDYAIVKDKVPSVSLPMEILGRQLSDAFNTGEADYTDGVRVVGDKFWLILRPSNTEPILRIIAEAERREEAERLVQQAKDLLKEHVK